MSKSLVQQQFGAHAAAYATSAVHAKGASLGRLVELVRPEKHWQMLDIATGAGHTAAAFAPHVARAVASDITEEMLAEALKLAASKGLANMQTAVADAEALPTTPDNPVGDPNNPAADWGTAIASFSLGASAQLNGSVLRVDGTAGADDLSVRVSAADSTKLEVLASGSVVATFDRSAVTSIQVYGHDGDDTFTVDAGSGSPLPSGGITFDGGAGNDRLVGPNVTNTWSLSAADGGTSRGFRQSGQMASTTRGSLA